MHIHALLAHQLSTRPPTATAFHAWLLILLLLLQMAHASPAMFQTVLHVLLLTLTSVTLVPLTMWQTLTILHVSSVLLAI